MGAGEALRRVLDGALDPIVAFDRSGSIVGWNRAAEAMLGWSKSEVLGHNVAGTILAPEDQPRLECALRRDVSELPGSLSEREVVDRRGHRIPVEVSFSATRLDGCVVYAAFMRDIRERRRAERLRDTEHRVSQVLVGITSGRELAIRTLPIVGDGFGWPAAEAYIVTERGLRGMARWTRDAGTVPAGEAVAPEAELACERREIVQGERGGVVAVPVRAGDAVFGVLVLYGEANRRPRTDELATLSNLGRQMGQFGERRRAETRLESETVAIAAVARATRRLS